MLFLKMCVVIVCDTIYLLLWQYELNVIESYQKAQRLNVKHGLSLVPDNLDVCSSSPSALIPCLPLSGTENFFFHFSVQVNISEHLESRNENQFKAMLWISA